MLVILYFLTLQPGCKLGALFNVNILCTRP